MLVTTMLAMFMVMTTIKVMASNGYGHGVWLWLWLKSVVPIKSVVREAAIAAVGQAVALWVCTHENFRLFISQLLNDVHLLAYCLLELLKLLEIFLTQRRGGGP